MGFLLEINQLVSDCMEAAADVLNTNVRYHSTSLFMEIKAVLDCIVYTLYLNDSHGVVLPN